MKWIISIMALLLFIGLATQVAMFDSWRIPISAISTLGIFILALFTALYAYNNLRINRLSSQRQWFASIMAEITGEEASYDRGLVVYEISKEIEAVDKSEEMEQSEKNRKKREVLQNLIKKGRIYSRKLFICRAVGRNRKKVNLDVLKGIAIERTIARYDRIGYLIMGEKKTPQIKPPTWLWTHINKIFPVVEQWIIHRQSCDENDRDYHRDYGKYFQNLYVYDNSHSRKS